MFFHKPIFYKKIGFVNANPFLEFMNKHAIFEENNSYSREKYFEKCKTFFLVERGIVNEKIIEEFMNNCDEIGNILNIAYGSGSSLNIQYSIIPKGQKINSHKDFGELFETSHRIHIPLITNDKVNFFIDRRNYNFKVGEVVEINNLKFHSVENDSEYDRIHLIIDYTPNHMKTLLR